MVKVSSIIPSTRFLLEESYKQNLDPSPWRKNGDVLGGRGGREILKGVQEKKIFSGRVCIRTQGKERH